MANIEKAKAIPVTDLVYSVTPEQRGKIERGCSTLPEQHYVPCIAGNIITIHKLGIDFMKPGPQRAAIARTLESFVGKEKALSWYNADFIGDGLKPINSVKIPDPKRE